MPVHHIFVLLFFKLLDTAKLDPIDIRHVCYIFDVRLESVNQLVLNRKLVSF